MASEQEMLNMSLSSERFSTSVQSFTLSKKFTKIIIQSSILNIMYQRVVLNEADLKTNVVQDTPIVVVKRLNPKDKLLRNYLGWTKGIYRAIDKNYLKEVYLFMKNSVTDDVIEMYKFSFKYNMRRSGELGRTPSHVTDATIEFLQLINQLGQHGKLNEHTEVEIGLTYCDSAPEDYRAPGFEPAAYAPHLFNSACTFHLGTVNTGFHKLTCHGDAEVLTNTFFLPPNSGTIAEEIKSSIKSGEDKENIAVELTEEEPAPAQKQTMNMSDITVSENNDGTSVLSVELTEEHFNCPCQLSLPLEVDIISCSICKKQYHAPCHGYRSRVQAIFSCEFVCFVCSNDEPFLLTKTDDIRTLCRLRLVLFYCERNGQIPVVVLKLFSESQRNVIYEKLKCFNILVGNKVNIESLRSVMEKFYYQDDSQVFVEEIC